MQQLFHALGALGIYILQIKNCLHMQELEKVMLWWHGFFELLLVELHCSQAMQQN